MIPKLINNQDKGGQVRAGSLFERQRNILLHAQMQKPIKRDKSHTQQSGKMKDWVIQELEIKTKAKEADKKNNASSKLSAYRKGDMNENEYDAQSSDHYDPLADSDDSSDQSDIEQKSIWEQNPELH